MPSIDALAFARWFAALHSATTAVETIHQQEPAEDAPAEVHTSFERSAADAIRLERLARDAMVHFLVDQVQDAPLAIVAADGSIVTYSDNADGLAIVAPASIIRMA